MELTACIVGAYFLGSIPVGYLVARSKGIDIRKEGSGNIGATNIWRVLGKSMGLLVLLLDVLKGFLPAIAGFYLLGHSQSYAFGVGLSAVAGHCLSPFLGFKGGKGVATGLGALAGSCPYVALCSFGVFLIVLALSRFVSLSSIIAALGMVAFGFFFRVDRTVLWALGLLAIFVIYRHRANIFRLAKGTESKFTLGPGA